MRTFFNIIILGLIGLCSSTYLFNLSPIDYRGTIEIQTPVEESTLTLQTTEKELQNPESITIKHVSSKEEVIKIVTESIFNVDIYKDNKLIESNVRNLELISPSVNTTISVSKDNPIITTLNISQKNLKLEDGKYTFVFTSNLIADGDKSSLTITATYDTGGKYYPAVNAAPPGTKGLTLYFVTEKDGPLIPVTRFVVEDKSITRMAIEQLQNGPLDNQLKSVIKDVTNTTYNNGNVVIDIPASYEDYNKEDIGELAYNSFVKTIFAVDRYWPIYSVTFTVDRNRIEKYFNGIETTSLPNLEKNYLIYMAYKAGDRYYLFDYELDLVKAGINDRDTVEIKAQKLFDAYYDIDLSYGINPVPKLTLNNTAMEGRTLILDFSEELLNVYKDRNDLRLMMIESLMYTFTTIPGVDSIKITVNGEELKNFVKDLDTTKVLYPPEFINPESVEITE